LGPTLSKTNYGPRWATNWHREFFSEVEASDIRLVIEERAIVMPALCQKQMLKAPTRRCVRRDYRTTCV
jgi:hypothetical protein